MSLSIPPSVHIALEMVRRQVKANLSDWYDTSRHNALSTLRNPLIPHCTVLVANINLYVHVSVHCVSQIYLYTAGTGTMEGFRNPL